jgi:hypothetical protein
MAGGVLVTIGQATLLSRVPKARPSAPFEDYSQSRAPIGAVSVGAVPFWGDAPDAWNTLIIAGRKVPGIAKVSGAAYDIRVDKKTVPGEHGEKQTTLGREPCDPELEVKLWTAEHLKAFLNIVRLFLPRAGGALPPPVDVVHPALAMFKVRSLRIMKCSFPEEREPGVFFLHMRCREFIPGKKGGKPKTDTASIEREGPGAVQKKVNALTTPAVTNGNAPRGKQPLGPVFGPPVAKTPGGV